MSRTYRANKPFPTQRHLRAALDARPEHDLEPLPEFAGVGYWGKLRGGNMVMAERPSGIMDDERVETGARRASGRNADAQRRIAKRRERARVAREVAFDLADDPADIIEHGIMARIAEDQMLHAFYHVGPIADAEEFELFGSGDPLDYLDYDYPEDF